MGAARRGLHERTHNFRCGIPSSTRSCGPKGQCPRRSPGPTAGLDRPRTASCCAYTVTEICRPCTVHLAQWRCRCSLRVWPSHRAARASRAATTTGHTLVCAILQVFSFSAVTFGTGAVTDAHAHARSKLHKKCGGAPTRTTASTHFVQAILFVQVPVAGWRKGATGSWKGQKGGERAEPEAGGRRGLTRMTGPGRATTPGREANEAATATHPLARAKPRERTKQTKDQASRSPRVQPAGEL